MGIVLKENPSIAWFFLQSYPPIADYLKACLSSISHAYNEVERREAEIKVLDSMHDWLIYVMDPAKYDQLEFPQWDDTSLLNLTDFNAKIVIDVGAGTGRLAFAVADQASVVYALEPVANLRRFLWEKRDKLGFKNVYPIDGVITQIPFPDHFADIVLAGHVFGDDCEREYNEMTRVIRDGGMIILHPGTNAGSDDQAHQFLVNKGFKFDTFLEPGDGLKRKYWKTIEKQGAVNVEK
jgi:ubiquinone/menaquinone biosynthesis C-methylase UbiE